MSMKMKHPLIKVGILAAILHAFVLFVVIPNASSRLAPLYSQEHFADGYDQLASNLETGNGYRFYPDTARTLMREPGYPVLLAGLQLTFGKSFAVVKTANMILALVTAWCIVVIARNARGGKKESASIVVLAAPLLFLFDPGVLIAECRGGVELLFALLLTVFAITVYRAVESNKWSDYAISGAVLGVTLCVRGTPILFPVWLLVYLLIVERSRVRKLSMLRNISVMILAMLTMLLPWAYRNYSVVGKVVPTASVLGVSAQAGQYIGRHLFEGRPWYLLDREASRERDKTALALGYPFKDGKNGYYQSFYRSEDEIKFSNYLFKEVVSEYAKTPLLFAKCVGLNVFNFWFAGKTWMATLGNFVVQFPYLILASVGMVIGFRTGQAKSVGPIVLLIGYVFAVHVPILAQARYSVPLFPLVCVLASMGLEGVYRKAARGFASGAKNEICIVDTSEVEVR